MRIHIQELKDVLRNVLDKKISREAASDWAFKLREAEDDNNLEYIPKDSEALIWDGIKFVEGIDLKDTPNTYLHNEFDIQMFLQKF
jgi:hypothetical protein